MTDRASEAEDDAGLEELRLVADHLEAARSAALKAGVPAWRVTEVSLMWAVGRAFDADPDGFGDDLIRIVSDVVRG
ncbi:hypothetical protein NK718_21700 [Alsobacter sp. SYSU M60028]|uniref:Uncharacterized protein n=1 Tax=Alsobacter ponti TaxID=2962936 RepID=A0ABT1LI18_9HYPH|nr:hypothetical protein [Alsobacter ponti]MCP8941144.1 hypothetical protein [Alsobacter ponti]